MQGIELFLIFDPDQMLLLIWKPYTGSHMCLEVIWSKVFSIQKLSPNIH